LIAKFKESAPSSTSTTPPPTTSHHLLPPPTKSDTAPNKDFARVPNSIARDALPAGIFKGTSKKLYDALYQRTRGAIQPTREIRARHNDLMEWARMSHNTLRTHLQHLERIGLIVRKWEVGDNNGAIYEVLIPEELDPSYHLLPPPTTLYQKLVPPSNQKLVGGGGGQVVEESTTYREPNTLIKTIEKIDDDEAFAGLVARLKETARAITGREPSASERPAWEELGELICTELKIASARTTVSSVPAFITEHLRRRLWKKNPKQVEEEGLKTQPEANTAPETASCPDCGGSGFYYPAGFDAGVAKCRHEKLKAPPPKQPPA
jgi:hypothetical protein